MIYRTNDKQGDNYMKNYLCINGKKIELTAEQVKKLIQEEVALSDFNIGDSFKIGDYEFIVLEQQGDETMCILKELYENNVMFGAIDNDYRNSIVKKKCDRFAEDLESLVGDGNLLEYELDLISADGLTDYKKINVKAAPLTQAQYQKYVCILDKERVEKWHWLSTPLSTKLHGCDTSVCCVSPSGIIFCVNLFNYFNIGVRPFCIFKSSIFVS